MWEIDLFGPNEVLDELARALAGKDPTLVKLPDRFVLRASTFGAAASADAVRAEGDRIVESLSGVARLLLRSEAPLGVGSVTEVHSDGLRSVSVQLQGLELRARVGSVSVVVNHANGTVDEHRHSDPAASWLRAALADPNLAKALRLRDAGELSWTALYRILEVIEAAVEENAMVAKGWTSRTAIFRFRRSAHSVAAAGDEARHGVETTQPPSRPMTLSEARAFMDSLLQRWIEAAAATMR